MNIRFINASRINKHKCMSSLQTGIRHKHFKAHETRYVAGVIYTLGQFSSVVQPLVFILFITGGLGFINFLLIIIWFFRVVINFGAGMKEKSM